MQLIIDAHEDLAWNILTFQRDYSRSALQTRISESNTSIPQYNGDTMLGWSEYQAGKIAVVFATLFASPKRRNKGPWDTQSYADGEHAYRLFSNQLESYNRLTNEYPEKFQLIKTSKELSTLMEKWRNSLLPSGKNNDPPVGLVILMEGAEAVRYLDDLEFWWEAGVRVIGPAWAGNRFCGGTREPGPLTTQGISLLEAMADLRFILDISHMDETAVRQALDIYPGKIIASHANASALIKGYKGNRHLNDNTIHHLIERDGIIGVIPFNSFLDYEWRLYKDRTFITLEKVVSQINHICQIAGDANHVGIGTDFDGGFGLQDTPIELETIADLQKLSALLEKNGYSEKNIASIMSQNWQHMLEYNLP
ncbi:MAG: membrane dipeptidase [Chloroflexota bacterium]